MILHYLAKIDMVHGTRLIFVLEVLFSFDHALSGCLLSHLLVPVDPHGVPLSMDLGRTDEAMSIKLTLGNGLTLELDVHHLHSLVGLGSKAVVVVLDTLVALKWQQLQALDVVELVFLLDAFEEIVEDVLAFVGVVHHQLVELVHVLRDLRLEALVHLHELH